MSKENVERLKWAAFGLAASVGFVALLVIDGKIERLGFGFAYVCIVAVIGARLSRDGEA